MAIDPRIIKGASNPELLEALRNQVFRGQVLSDTDTAAVRGEIVARGDDVQAAPASQVAQAAARAERQRADALALRPGLERGTGATAGGIAAAAERQRVEALLGYGNRAAAAAAPLRPQVSPYQTAEGAAAGAPLRPEPRLPARAPELGENVTALAELQRAQLQAEHDLQIREQFGTGADLPFRTTAPEFAQRLGEAIAAGARSGDLPFPTGWLTKGFGALADRLPGGPPDAAAVELHERTARELFGGPVPSQVTPSEFANTVFGGVDAAGAAVEAGVGGLGRGVANFLRGGDLTPEQIAARNASQREHQRQIAMQFGTGPIPGGGFSDAEEADYDVAEAARNAQVESRAQQLVNEARAHERASTYALDQLGYSARGPQAALTPAALEARALDQLGFSPRAPQSTLPPVPPVPPLPTGAEATFGPEYGWPVQPGLRIPADDLQALAAANTRQTRQAAPNLSLDLPRGQRLAAESVNPQLLAGDAGLSAALDAVSDQWDFSEAGQKAGGRRTFGAPTGVDFTLDSGNPPTYEGGRDVFGFRLGTPPLARAADQFGPPGGVRYAAQPEREIFQPVPPSREVFQPVDIPDFPTSPTSFGGQSFDLTPYTFGNFGR